MYTHNHGYLQVRHGDIPFLGNVPDDVLFHVASKRRRVRRIDMSRAPLLNSLARFVRSFFAGRRKSDAAFARLLHPSSNAATAWKELSPSPDAKTPLCPRCGAVMIHAKGERITRPEFWACSRLDCEGVREVE